MVSLDDCGHILPSCEDLLLYRYVSFFKSLQVWGTRLLEYGRLDSTPFSTFMSNYYMSLQVEFRNKNSCLWIRSDHPVVSPPMYSFTIHFTIHYFRLYFYMYGVLMLIYISFLPPSWVVSTSHVQVFSPHKDRWSLLVRFYLILLLRKCYRRFS